MLVPRRHSTGRIVNFILVVVMCSRDGYDTIVRFASFELWKTSSDLLYSDKFLLGLLNDYGEADYGLQEHGMEFNGQSVKAMAITYTKFFTKPTKVLN